MESLPKLPLLQAIIQRDISLVRSLLEQGNIDINGMLNDTSLTYLHCALLTQNKEIIALLLEQGAKVNVLRVYGWTPLHHTVYQEPVDKELVQLLLKHGADVHARNVYGKTPLHLAASVGNREIIPLLLEHGAEIDAQDQNGMVPLQAAFNYCSGPKKLKTIKTLLEHGASIDAPNKCGMTLLHSAAKLIGMSLLPYCWPLELL